MGGTIVASVSGYFGDHSKSSVDDEDDDRHHTIVNKHELTQDKTMRSTPPAAVGQQTHGAEVSGKLNAVCPWTDADGRPDSDAAAAGPRESQRDRQTDRKTDR